MNVGYDKALVLLPFDHRHSYVKSLFKLEPPLSAQQGAPVSDRRQLIYEGFVRAIEQGVPRAAGGILVDEQFGADILRDARRRGFVSTQSTKQSGAEEFELDYGAEFARHIESFDPTNQAPVHRRERAGGQASHRRCEGGSRRVRPPGRRVPRLRRHAGRSRQPFFTQGPMSWCSSTP